MRFTETPIPGAFTIEPERLEDERGFFARWFCEREFAGRGLEARYVQANNTMNRRKGTLRGFHYQLPPAAEAKLVRCIAGALWDAVLDLRPGAASFGTSFGVELSAANRRMMYIPRGCAHAFLTLADDTELLYLVSDFYAPDLERGVRWNDPAFSVDWPMPPTVISPKDRDIPDFVPPGRAA